MFVGAKLEKKECNKELRKFFLENKRCMFNACQINLPEFNTWKGKQIEW